LKVLLEVARSGYINPSFFNKKNITAFSNTFKTLCFEYLVNSITQHFINIVVVVERIEQTVRARRFSNISKVNQRKRGFSR
jgi:hypothetical protein